MMAGAIKTSLEKPSSNPMRSIPETGMSIQNIIPRCTASRTDMTNFRTKVLSVRMTHLLWLNSYKTLHRVWGKVNKKIVETSRCNVGTSLLFLIQYICVNILNQVSDVRLKHSLTWTDVALPDYWYVVRFLLEDLPTQEPLSSENRFPGESSREGHDRVDSQAVLTVAKNPKTKDRDRRSDRHSLESYVHGRNEQRAHRAPLEN